MLAVFSAKRRTECSSTITNYNIEHMLIGPRQNSGLSYEYQDESLWKGRLATLQ